MKNLPRYILSLAICTLIISGCKESFVSGFSKDPNHPTDVPAKKVFIAAQTGEIVYFEGYAARLAGMWSQQFVGIGPQYENKYLYGVNTQNFNSIWPFPFVRVLGNLNVVENKIRDNKNKKAF